MIRERRIIIGFMLVVLLLITGIFSLFTVRTAHGEEAAEHALIYDEAGLLTQDEHNRLTEMARKYGMKRETDIVIYTTDNVDNQDVVMITQDFYDEHALGYDKSHGNTVILTMDMRNRDVYLAGFYKAKTYLDDGRLEQIRNKITPDLSAGNYEQAFESYITTASRYMGVRPGVNPDNLLFNGWFQLAISALIGGIVVAMMAYRSGGRVTVNHQTYEDSSTSGIQSRQDLYLRTTTTRRKIEKNNNNGGGGFGGGGGGTTRGGHSHSGSRGSF